MRLFILFTYVTHTFTYVIFSMFYNIGDKTEKCISWSAFNMYICILMLKKLIKFMKNIFSVKLQIFET